MTVVTMGAVDVGGCPATAFRRQSFASEGEQLGEQDRQLCDMLQVAKGAGELTFRRPPRSKSASIALFGERGAAVDYAIGEVHNQTGTARLRREAAIQRTAPQTPVDFSLHEMPRPREARSGATARPEEGV